LSLVSTGDLIEEYRRYLGSLDPRTRRDYVNVISRFKGLKLGGFFTSKKYEIKAIRKFIEFL